jgi:photosystem II stability/assembly factor-like uncharacterized protein
MSRSKIRPLLFVAVGAVIILGSADVYAGRQGASQGGSQSSPQISPEQVGQLVYRYIGPQGNRMDAVVGVPGNPDIYYAGAASGGIFKTIDGGIQWKPIFDSQNVSSVGSLAIAPSDPEIVWAGTGETFIRSNISIGNGIYKSTDGGKNWQNMGLEKTGRIGRIVIDPRNPDIVFAAAMGHCYGPQPDRGVFRTTDGGKTWERVLFVDENTGAADIAMDPKNPRILFAGMWTLDIKTWGQWSGGPGSGLFTSRDGGTTWKKITGHGLPTTPVGKIGLGISHNNPSRVYAIIETGDGEPRKDMETSSGILWRSDDGGDNWKLVNSDHDLTQRPHYYSRMGVSPDNQNEIYTLAPTASISLDGGLSFTRFPVAGGDHHDIWIDPTNANRMAVANDQFVTISTNRGRTWRGIPLPNAQMYHVAVDNKIPYWVYGNRQDGPSTTGPSNSLTQGKIPSGMWHHVGACESGFAVPDTVDNVVYSGCFAAGLTRYDLKTGHARSIEVWPESYMGAPAGDVKYRIQWTFPITISPHDHNTVYTGSQYVHQTTDGGHTWKVISPDLTTNDKSHQENSGGLTTDNLGVEYGCVVFAIAESPLEKGVIWAGTNDGLVQVTRDAGAHWTNVTGNIPNLPPLGTVSNIEPSKYDAGTTYLTVDFHQVNNRDPFIYKTTDYGKTWKSISSDIPKSVHSYAHVVREDPVKKGLLYAGTENALYVSFNDGGNWLPLQTNLPHAPVHWLTIQEHFNDLVVATYGRGFWILDDISPLRQLTQQVVQADAFLFTLRPAYRFLHTGSSMTPQADQAEGDNPPYGADITYWLKDAPKGDVKISILDEKGGVIRTLKGNKQKGINRIWWDLRYEKSKEPKLRTSPLYAPWLQAGPEGRTIVTWGVRPDGIAPLAAPGTFTVKLLVDGKDFSEKLTVRKDPNSTSSEADIRAQLKMMLDARDKLNNVIDMINQVEVVRKQIYDLSSYVEGRSDADTILKAGKDLDQKLIAFEENLFQMRLAGGGQDVFRNPTKLYEHIGFLAQMVETSWGNVGSDYPPTAAEGEVDELLTKQTVTYQGQLKTLIDQNIPAFNNLLLKASLKPVIVP